MADIRNYRGCKSSYHELYPKTRTSKPTVRKPAHSMKTGYHWTSPASAGVLLSAILAGLLLGGLLTLLIETG